ncbi:hypothetical protein [Tabrizicola sp.]|uniref:hypothetical protein n=1 Tax=Tabrizicola sp. TaxID=2005166 RepID=UPI0026220343|nr:hypothetical protein [Tabrizicola sp.]MDM7931686.1 hypothetical protein [Tabrizicola sp.]
MDERKRVLHIYLHSPWRQAAEAGEVNLFRRMQAALPDWRLKFHPDTPAERLKAPGRGGYGLFHMQAPNGPRILCLRRAYILPFWRIEAVSERWLFDVAQERFDADTIPKDEADGFVRRWRPKLLGDGASRQDGYVLVPLQGRISEHRSFQEASPLAMLETVLERIATRRVVATLHPKEVYTPAELAALEDLERRFPRFTLVGAQTPALLLGCDAVVTQNSSVALHGFFADKPAVLFAQSDFHHIAGSVPKGGLDAAFAALDAPPPDFARYLCWFFRRQAINGGAPDCEAQIVARFRRHGWQV